MHTEYYGRGRVYCWLKGGLTGNWGAGSSSTDGRVYCGLLSIHDWSISCHTLVWYCRTRFDSDKILLLSLEFTIEVTPTIPYIRDVFLSIVSLSFWFFDDFEGNANISVTIKSGSTVAYVLIVQSWCLVLIWNVHVDDTCGLGSVTPSVGWTDEDVSMHWYLLLSITTPIRKLYFALLLKDFGLEQNSNHMAIAVADVAYCNRSRR